VNRPSAAQATVFGGSSIAAAVIAIGVAQIELNGQPQPHIWSSVWLVSALSLAGTGLLIAVAFFAMSMISREEPPSEHAAAGPEEPEPGPAGAAPRRGPACRDTKPRAAVASAAEGLPSALAQSLETGQAETEAPRAPEQTLTDQRRCASDDLQAFPLMNMTSLAMPGSAGTRGQAPPAPEQPGQSRETRLLRTFDEDAWKRTVYLIQHGQCTPFIGAGASAEHVPLAGDLAATLASEYGFPFQDHRDLARVTQFAAVREGSRQYVKQRFADDMFGGVSLPDFRAPDEPYALLADLQLPVYVTTNYDDFMYEALKDRGRAPQRAICPWYTKDPAEVEETTRMFRETAGYNPDGARPIVYYLHGHHGTPESLVLTEDDYIDFLVRVSGDPDLLPPVIQKALRSKMLLFVGYSLADWTFRVIFQGLLAARPPLAGHSHVSVQLPPPAEGPADDRPLRIQEYLDRYFQQQNISICWKPAREFSAELRRRWEAR
jgi:SIR2-like domain